MTRRALRVLLAVLLVALLALTCASAAGMPVRAADLYTTSRTHPCPGPGTATPETGTVTTVVNVLLPSSACDGLAVQITLSSPGGAVLASGTATAAAGRTQISLTSPVPTTATLVTSATVDGWALPLTWSPSHGAGGNDEPVYHENTPTALAPVTWTLTTNNPVQVCFTSSVTTTSLTPVTWRVTLDLSRAPFNGATASGFQMMGADAWRYRWFPDTPGVGYLQLGGTVEGGRESIVAGQVYDVQVCNWGLPPGVQTPSAYTVTSTRTTWTSTRACVATTVTGNGSERFYFAWTAALDMRPAVEALTAGGRTLSAYTYSSNEWMLTRTPADDLGSGRFRVTSNTAANLHASEAFTFETCAVSY